jgi:hypothetical protein
MTLMHAILRIRALKAFNLDCFRDGNCSSCATNRSEIRVIEGILLALASFDGSNVDPILHAIGSEQW